ncbi:hypothetical protein HanIR_Chr13g0628031 [Helianthus annuus]|nr:hypothetical protein HanIR_Chr13g0628031 [Helianthus annuus]
MIVSEQLQSVVPQTVEEVTPLEFHETLGGNLSGAATTTIESIGLQLDSGYILKTPLNATTVEAITVTSVPVGSPQNQEKRQFVYDDLESSPIIKTNIITTCRNSDDPIKLGDEFRYKELTDRMALMETSVADMKEMLKYMMELSKSQPSTQQIANELWNFVQPILHAQKNLAEINHNTHMELIRNMVDARYKDTQADIKDNKEHLVKITGSAPTTIIQDGDDDDDDAKKGEKDSLRKLHPDSKVKAKPKPKPKVQQRPESAQPKTSVKASEAGKEKGIDETLNKKAEEIALKK